METSKETEKVKDDYVKGFNNAYLLQEHKPKLVEGILTTKTTNNYIKGMRDGKNTFEQTKAKSRFQDLQNLKGRNDKNLDLDLER